MNLVKTVIYCDLEGVFLCGSIPVQTVWVQYFWCKGCFWYGCQPRFSSECAGHYPLDRGCDWCYGFQSLNWMLVGGLLFAHSPVEGRVCVPAVGVELLRVGFYKAPLPLSAWFVPKEVSGSKWGPCGHSKPICCPCRNLWFCLEAAQGCIPFSVVFSPDLVLGWCWGPGCCHCRNWVGCAVAWDLGCFCGRPLPEPVIPDPAPSTGVGWAELVRSRWKINHLCTPPQGLSTRDVNFCGATWCVHQTSSVVA